MASATRGGAEPGETPIPPALPRSERLLRILERDGPECVWCRRPLPPGHRDLSYEHVIPRLKGGPAWAENEVAACRSCNRARGHTAPAAWLEACESRGWRPNRGAIERSLLRLRGAIAARGGQRRGAALSRRSAAPPRPRLSATSARPGRLDLARGAASASPGPSLRRLCAPGGARPRR